LDAAGDFLTDRFGGFMSCVADRLYLGVEVQAQLDAFADQSAPGRAVVVGHAIERDGFGGRQSEMDAVVGHAVLSSVGMARALFLAGPL
jgi:hypothetical protein